MKLSVEIRNIQIYFPLYAIVILIAYQKMPLHLAAFQIQLTILLMQPLLCSALCDLYSQTSHRVECAVPVSPLVVFSSFAGAELFSLVALKFFSLRHLLYA